MLNHIVIMGRLTREPELRTTQSGVNVASFSVAVDRDFGGRDGGERQTDFFDVSAWRQTGEFVSKYFHKGAWDIQADNVYFGESKRDSDAGSYSQSSYGSQSGNYGGYNTAPQSAPAPQVSPSPYEELEDDGELPF